MIDTLKLAKRLQQAGMPQAEAEAIAEGFDQEAEANLASRHDIADLRKDIAQIASRMDRQEQRMDRLEQRMTDLQKAIGDIWWKIAGLLLAHAGLVVALGRLAEHRSPRPRPPSFPCARRRRRR